MEFSVVHFIMDVLLHIAMIGVAIPAVFFTYGTHLQKDVIKTEVYKVVHDLLRPIMGIVAYVFKDFEWDIETSDSEKSQNAKNSVIRERVKRVLIGVFVVSFALFVVILLVSGKPVPWWLIFTNVVLVGTIIVTEIVFLYVFVRKFRPIDVDDINVRIVARLERYAASA